jgi:hypothetical protein
MAITDNQKIDYLFKKVGFGAAKTDTVANKLAANESIPSPLLIRGDTIWAESGNIPPVKPASSSGPVTIRTAIETTPDITATGNRTWLTGITDWIPTQFGSTYLIDVFIHDSGDPVGAVSLANKVFTTGSGNDDEWFFDYEAGVLNFIGTNLPHGKSFDGKSVYISGATYTGTKGVASAEISADISGLQSQVDNILSNTDPATLDSLTEIVNAFQQGDIELELTVGDGTTSASDTTNIVFDSGSGFTVTDNGNGQVTISSDVSGQVSTDLADLEALLRNDLALPVVQHPTADTFTGDGSTVNFTLTTTPANADAIDVYIDSVIQPTPEIYTVSGNTLNFLFVPLNGQEIYVKYRTTAASVQALPNNVITSANLQDQSVQARHLDLQYTSNQFNGDGVQTSFTIASGHNEHSVLVIKNGLVLTPQEYGIVNQVLALNDTPQAGDVIDIRYLPI